MFYPSLARGGQSFLGEDGTCVKAGTALGILVVLRGAKRMLTEQGGDARKFRHNLGCKWGGGRRGHHQVV